MTKTSSDYEEIRNLQTRLTRAEKIIADLVALLEWHNGDDAMAIRDYWKIKGGKLRD